MKRFLGISGLSIVFALLFYFSFPAKLADMKIYDIYTCIRGGEVSLENLDNIVIVGIDEESFREMKLPWPWPRSIHGKLIKALKNLGAKLIVMDIIFSDLSTPREDKAMAEAIKQFGGIVLAADIEIVRTERFAQKVLITPLKEFLNAGASYGVSSIPVDTDNVVRHIFWGSPEIPSLEVAVLEKLGISRERDERKMVNFIGPAYQIPYVPYYKVLRNDFDFQEEFFKNKVVMVGKYSRPSRELVTDLSSKDKHRYHFQPPSPVRGVDMFATPFYIMDNRLTPGIEIHANMLSSLIRNDLIKPLRAVEAIVFIVLLSVFLTIINLNWRPLKNIGLNLLFTMIYLIFSYLLLTRQSLFIPFAAPFLAIFINFVSSGVSSYMGVEKKRRYLKRAFSLYLSPQVADKVLEEPDKLKLGGQRVLATVLFSDLADFTKISEKIEPEEVVSILTRYNTEMTRIIFKYNGTLDKFVGDAIMAIWGAPVKDEDQAFHACLAALEMQGRMKTLANEINIPDQRLSMRIGINTGSVMAGNMGSEERFDFTVIGDNVNIASRLESLNKTYGTEILIGESTYAKIGGRLTIRELDWVRVKGKSQLIKIFELMDGGEKLFVDIFEEGLHLYQNGYFDAAHRKFIEALKINPMDKPSKLYIERCVYLMNSPPQERWSGVWEFPP